MRNCSLRIQTMLSNRSFTLSPVASLRRWYEDSKAPQSTGAGGRWRRGRTVRSAQRQIIGHLAGQFLRPWRLAGFTHRGRHFRARIAWRNPRRRFGWCTRRCRRDFWRFDGHLHRALAIAAGIETRAGYRHISLHGFWSITARARRCSAARRSRRGPSRSGRAHSSRGRDAEATLYSRASKVLLRVLPAST
jgi:hypothetical protein